MTPAEMKAKGYTTAQDGEVLTVFKNGERVASLSPLWPRGSGGSSQLAFDWHRFDQWGLNSRDVVALHQAQGLVWSKPKE